MKRGKLIVLEGIVGCGKTTQVAAIREELDNRKIKYFYGREPGGDPIAEKIRKIILENKNIDPLAEVFLFEAARRQFVENKVRPKIEEGIPVITDRYYWSTIAFQGYGKGVDLSTIYTLNKYAISDIHPDLTFILDVEDINAARVRAKGASDKIGEKDKFEDEEIKFHTKVRDGYRKIAMSYPNVCLVPNFEQESDVKARISQIRNYMLDKLIQFIEPQGQSL